MSEKLPVGKCMEQNVPRVGGNVRSEMSMGLSGMFGYVVREMSRGYIRGNCLMEMSGRNVWGNCPGRYVEEKRLRGKFGSPYRITSLNVQQ